MQCSYSVHARFMHSSCERVVAAAQRLGQACWIALVAMPAAAGSFTPPESCTLTMTVQQRSCTVAQHFICTTDAPGDQRVAYFTRDGLVYDSLIDAETRWLSSRDYASGITDTLEDEAEDHASLKTLLATGRDDFDFWTVSDSGERLRHVGHDVLTGKTVIDGLTLDLTRFELKTFSASGDLLIERSGSQFVSRETRRFYGGLETSRDREGTEDNSNDTPVRFIRPGQAGFASTEPQYDCDQQMVGSFNGGGA